MCVRERDIVKNRENVFVYAYARESTGKAALAVNECFLFLTNDQCVWACVGENVIMYMCV